MVPRAGFEFCLCGEIDWIVIDPDIDFPAFTGSGRAFEE